MTETERIAKFDDMMKGVVPYYVRNKLIERGFFTAPASTKYHGSYEGGLFDHCYMVAFLLNRLTKDNGLAWKNSRSPLLIGMFHDLCKIDSYRHPTSDELKWEYNPNTLIKGHGDKSVMLLSEYFSLTQEEILCIRYHMGAFTDKEEWKDYTRAVNKYPNILWTHHADMLSAHVKGV